MVAALGVHRSQGTSLRFSGAKLLAVSAPGCVLALLAFFWAFLPLQRREQKSRAERGLQISLVKWSLWHLGYSCAHLIRARRAWSSLAKKCFLLDLCSFLIWHIKKGKKILNRVAFCPSVSLLNPLCLCLPGILTRENWLLAYLMFKRSPICALYQVTWI